MSEGQGKFVVDEIYKLEQSPETQKALDRLIRKSRINPRRPDRHTVEDLREVPTES